MGKKLPCKQQKEKMFEVKDFYVPLSIAKEEIKRRWANKKLRQKVTEFLGEVPEPFKKNPRAILSRNIITPSAEFMYFYDLAKHIGLKPIGLEGIEDKFCTKNAEKVCLGKLNFYDKKDITNKYKNTESKKSVVKIINLETSDGKKICDIKTLWGEKLVDFHHRMLKTYEKEIEIFDDFKWFSKRNRKNSLKQYYENFFSLCVCFGVLFENFFEKGAESDFTNNIAIPVFEKIKEMYGVAPLIVPLLPREDEDEWYFRSYI